MELHFVNANQRILQIGRGGEVNDIKLPQQLNMYIWPLIWHKMGRLIILK